jgi:two-component system phosphate regulon sensor histidine kinase PhoR
VSLGRSRTFWRLFTSYGLLALGSIGVIGWLVDRQVEQRERESISESLRVKAILVEQAFGDSAAGLDAARQARVIALGKECDTRITLLAADGRVLADSDEDPTRMENHREREEIKAAAAFGTGTDTRLSHTLNRWMMYSARRTGRTDGVAFVRVAWPLNSVDRQVTAIRRIVWGVAAGTAVLVLLLAFWLAWRAVVPLRALTDGAQRLAAGEYGLRVYGTGKDEIGELAQAFNAMSEQLATQFAQVEEDRRQLRAVLSGMVEGVVAIDAEQRVLFANERAGQLLEVLVPQVVGRKLWEVVRQAAILEIVRRALAVGEPVHEQLDWAGPAVKNLAVHVAPLSGSPTGGAVLVLHDISELRRLERVRQEFVANVSHELKTPLSVIKVCIETLLDGAVDDAENRGAFLDQIDEQANRLHVLILDLLNLARIESGAEVFQMELVPLEEAVAACIERHRARAEAKQQSLLTSSPEIARILPEVGQSLTATDGTGLAAVAPHPQQAELAAWADEEAVGQILDNLVDNAIKYTPTGGKICVRCHAEDGQACLEVADDGIGIPERDLPRIFERFYRVDKARSRELGGTGLGLSIVKHLVQAMHGTVWATSKPGQGTTFHIRLPRAPAA